MASNDFTGGIDELRVYDRALTPSEPGRLAIQTTPDTGGTVIDLEFAAGATIRLRAAAISCRARDFGEPWPTAWLPDHERDAPG